MEDEHARQPADTIEQEEEPPVGWKRLIPGGKWRIFRLSPEHPDYPKGWLAKHRTKERRRLDQSGHAAVAIESFRQVWEAAELRMRAATTFDEWFEVYQLLDVALERDARLIPFGDRFARRAYLAEQVLPDYLFSLAGESDISPVEIIVNNDTIPIPIDLAPGEVVIRLADLPATPLIAEFKTFITEAQQEILGYEDQRGRPLNPDRAKQIADLKANAAGTARDIVKAVDGRSVSGNTARKKVQRAVSRIEDLNIAKEATAAPARADQVRTAQEAWAQSPHGEREGQ